MATPRGLGRLGSTTKTIQVTGEVVGEPDAKDEPEFDKYELEDAVRTLERAAEIRQDAKLMAALGPHLDKKVAAIKSLDDMRAAAKKAKA